MQKVLICNTKFNYLRDKIIDYGAESGDEVRAAISTYFTDGKYHHTNDVPIDGVNKFDCPKYPTILHALADGWRLLAPPYSDTMSLNQINNIISVWTWWLVKD